MTVTHHSPPIPGAADSAPLDYGNLPDFLESASGWVAAALGDFLPRGEPAQLLYDLIRDYPERGGKRFRPALMLLSCALTGGDPREALPTALALELFHNFALVHDDIEDASLLRRGQPTLHRKHGIPLALNAGDTLFALVYEALAQNPALLGPERAERVQGEVQAVIRRTLEGQAWDIGWVAHGHWPSREEYQTMIRHKTGWYSGRGPCRIGALLAGAPEETVSLLGDFGELLGIGFQVRDDLLNLAEDTSDKVPGSAGDTPEGYGKERGGDIAEGKRTLIVIETLERISAAEGARLREILVMPPDQTVHDGIEWAIARARDSGALEAVEARCQELGRKAHALLDRLPDSTQRNLFREMVDYLVLNRRG